MVYESDNISHKKYSNILDRREVEPDFEFISLIWADQGSLNSGIYGPIGPRSKHTSKRFRIERFVDSQRSLHFQYLGKYARGYRDSIG